MKTSKLAAVFSAVIALGIASPSFAADKSEGLQTAVDGALMVTRVGGVGAGCVVGTPIAIARETFKYYKTWTPDWADKIGGKDCGPCCALVSLVSLPVSMVAGTVTGTYYGARNGMVKGFNEPFHPDSFSLGKELEE